jgi:hypothetical protein
MNPTLKGKGARKDKRDKRDFRYSEIAGSVKPFDWKTGYDVEKETGIKLVVKDQGQSSSCGGQAWSYYGTVLNFVHDKTFVDKSARFIYSQTFYPNGGGSTGRDNSDLVVKQGWGRESLITSYEDGKPPTEAFMRRQDDITDAMRMDAALDKAFSYASVDTTIDQIATAIRDNYGCVIGVTGQNNGTWLSKFPAKPTKGEWNHWVYAVGAVSIGGKKYIKIINSWGSDAGDDGYQCIGEDYFKGGWVFSGWTLMFNVLYKHTFYTSMSFGDIGPDVMYLQRCLQTLGLLPKEQDCTGFYGVITKNAVFDFQRKYVITNPVTWARVWYSMGRDVGPLTIPALNKIFGI